VSSNQPRIDRLHRRQPARPHPRRALRQRVILLVVGAAFALTVRLGLAAPEHYGQVLFGGLPVPGATVTASRDDTQRVATTDQQGIYRFTDLADGPWSMKVEMLGFAPASRDVTVSADAMPMLWELAILPFAEITRGLPSPVAAAAVPGSGVAG